ncbi:MAG: caspase family protein [Halioglobus sp.]
MAKGISLHIGVNRLDPASYQLAPTNQGWQCVVVNDEGEVTRFPGNFNVAWEGPLTSCEKDAEDMQALARRQKFSTKILRTQQATAKSVETAIRKAAKKLKSGDTFLLSYAGHGSQVEDLTGDEWDGTDETWCLYDRMFLDDEQRALYAEFDKGVNIVVLSDSCHSGTATRSVNAEDHALKQHRGQRSMSERTAMAVYEGNKKMYDKIQRALPNPPPKLKASRILLAACQDHEHAHGDDENGVFTRALLKVWSSGAFEGSYSDLARAIRQELQAQYESAMDKAEGDASASAVKLQVPNFVRITGTSKKALSKLSKQKAFSI